MLQKIKEKTIIKNIKKEIENINELTPIRLNLIRTEASQLLLNKKISYTFWKNIFFTDSNKTWYEANFENILNYK